ncbi:MAG: ISAs1 family transposase [Bacteroidota bacterium]
MYEGQFFESFAILEDIREQGKVWHKMIDIIFIVVSAVICNCNEWKEIHLWATIESNETWLKRYIELPHGIPSLSTIGRLFNIVSPKQFEKCFIEWMKSVVQLEEKDIISLDGKTMRGSIEGDSKRGVHIVSALCNSHSLVIGQVKTEEKSNEITAIPELLDMLYIKGCIVTIDAIGCQKKIVDKIINECESDYVLNVKSNQEALMNDVVECFQNLEKDGKKENLELAYKLSRSKGKPLGDEQLAMVKTLEKGHGRIEKRTYYYTTDISWMIDARKDWAGLTGVGMVERETETAGETTKETSYYIGSIYSVKEFEKAVRNHWKIESMHWCLDVTYGDDANRTRKGTSPQNMALLKRIAFNTVKNDTKKHPKQSMKGKRFIASMDFKYRDYLIDLNFKSR